MTMASDDELWTNSEPCDPTRVASCSPDESEPGIFNCKEVYHFRIRSLTRGKRRQMRSLLQCKISESNHNIPKAVK